MYCVGLSLVLRKLNKRIWPAFLPIYNYKVLIESLGLPERWFFYSLVPYAGTVYSVAVAERLGKIFSRGFVFSSFWLTIGSPIGMYILGLGKTKPNYEIISSPPPKLSSIKAKMKRQKTSN